MYKDGPIFRLKWMDKRPVSVLSTIHDDSTTQEGTRITQKPTVIVQYNTYMGGVDLADQLVTYYGYPHVSRKWWKQVFYHLFDTTLVNAYILYCQCTPNRLSRMDFRLRVAHGLIAGNIDTSPRPVQVSDTPLCLIGCHFLIPGQKRDCKVCSKRSA